MANVLPEVINHFNIYDDSANKLIGISGEIELPEMEAMRQGSGRIFPEPLAWRKEAQRMGHFEQIIQNPAMVILSVLLVIYAIKEGYELTRILRRMSSRSRRGSISARIPRTKWVRLPGNDREKAAIRSPHNYL